MRRHILLYGGVAALLLLGLKLLEYRWLVVEHSLEIYGGVVAAVFAGLGIWLGLKLTTPRERVVVREVPVPVEVPVAVPAGGPFVRDAARVEALGLTPRELEILELIAQGLSTREMAERVGVSENTVKTHASRVFDKLGARRRTQAVQIGKAERLIP